MKGKVVRKMETKIILLVYLILIVLTNHAFADYPIVSYRHLADPGALVYNGRVYLYCSNDDDNVVEEEGYDMRSIVCVSSSDLKNWTDHGIVFQVPEGASWAQNSWAPSPAERDGMFYLYFGDGGSSIGVAVADSPTGPFIDAIGNRLVSSSTPGVLPADNIWIFDPMTFIDDDGQAYMYFGGNGEDNLRVIKLNEDMISLDSAATRFHVPYFFEAAWMHKNNGIYYFSYSTNPSNGMRIDYMTSDNPTTGFTYGGVLSPQPPNNNNNNHQAIFKFNEGWYEAYHNRIVAQQAGIPTTYKRNLCLDQFSHNEDGSIETMVNTVDGVEQVVYLNPFQRIEAETIGDQGGVETEVCSAGGMNVTNIADSEWIRVRGVDFGSTGPAAFTASVASDIKIGSSSGESIEIRLDGVTGTLIGTVPISYTGGLYVWKTETAAIEEAIGVHDVYFVFTGENSENLFNFDYWYFIEKTGVHDLLAINASVEKCKIDTVAGDDTTNITVTAIYTDGTSEDVTSETSFTFDQPNIISITDSIVTGLNYGIVTATASYNDNTDSVKVVVKDLESELIVSQIYSDASDIELFVGNSTIITITAEFGDGHFEDVTEKATYDNPSPEIATISNGIITGGSEGEVDITVSYQGQIGEAKSTTIHVTVRLGTAVWLESECGEVGENWDILTDAQASNGYYVTVKPGIQSLDNAPTGSENQIVILFSLDTGGNFSIYARLNCPTYDDDSFWIQVDDGAFSMHNGLVTSGWEWIEFNDYTLTEGEHTLTVGYREDGAKMDKIVISNYGTAPEGMGEEAENLCEPTSIFNLNDIPQGYSLEQNFPNPFNPSTKIKYSLPKPEKVKLDVYNIIGQKIETLLNKPIPAGYHEVEFNGQNLSSGIYLYRIQVGRWQDVKKMLLIK
jgi:arabinoxylan arabinofuranohydrolase